MRKTMDVVALGELLIDFTESGMSPQGNFLFEANPGGAPCNVLAMLQNLGKKTAFIGKVGKDFLGEHLKEEVKMLGIDVSGLSMDNEVHTTLAFVHTGKDGDRDFSFYRNPGADMKIAPEDIPFELIDEARIFHFGSISMTHDGCRQATKKAIKRAGKAGCIITFDPNLREPLWSCLEDARKQIVYGIEHCHILKIADNELQWFTGVDDLDKGMEELFKEYHVPMVVLSMGKEGSRVYYQNQMVERASFLQKDTIETTGAGDTFFACILNYILEHGMTELSSEDLMEMLTFANAAASIITTKKGALRVMPQKEEVENFLHERC